MGLEALKVRAEEEKATALQETSAELMSACGLLLQEARERMSVAGSSHSLSRVPSSICLTNDGTDGRSQRSTSPVGSFYGYSSTASCEMNEEAQSDEDNSLNPDLPAHRREKSNVVISPDRALKIKSKLERVRSARRLQAQVDALQSSTAERGGQCEDRKLELEATNLDLLSQLRAREMLEKDLREQLQALQEERISSREVSASAAGDLQRLDAARALAVAEAVRLKDDLSKANTECQEVNNDLEKVGIRNKELIRELGTLKSQLSTAQVALEEAKKKTPFLAQLKEETASVKLKAKKEAKKEFEAAFEEKMNALCAQSSTELLVVTNELASLEDISLKMVKQASIGSDLIDETRVKMVSRIDGSSYAPASSPLSLKGDEGKEHMRWTRAAVMDADLVAETEQSGEMPKAPLSVPISSIERDILLVQQGQPSRCDSNQKNCLVPEFEEKSNKSHVIAPKRSRLFSVRMLRIFRTKSRWQQAASSRPDTC